MSGLWRIQLLGGLRAERGGRAVSRFRTRQTGALLARLALFPRRAHAREELADLLWPEADAGAGRNRLRVAVSSLRRVLEPPGAEPGSVLWADRGSVRLNPSAFVCDAAEFEAALARAGRAASPAAAREALEAAASLFAGELLPGFYDDWVAEERERLNALRDELRERLAETPPASPPREAPVPRAPLSNAVAPPRLLGVPLRFTRFFGREREMSQLAGLLRDPRERLVTLTGAGGSGKTRLAVEAVRRLAGTDDGPVWFVPLADLTAADLIPAAVVEALGLARAADKDPLEQVVAALVGEPRAVLLLDNFEQLVERGAPLVLSLLTRLPALTCLVTSRRRLGLPGEREFLVAPLPLPPPEGTPEQVMEAAGAQMFVDRAQASRPDFQLTRGNAGSVAVLCRTLEGIPLALELVAARAHALTPAQMVERLTPRFDLAGEPQQGEGRHHSLWAAMAWSLELIPPPLQRFFAGLSVFRGGCTPEAAAIICENPQALEALTQLRERSLALVEEGRGGLRFRLLETLREFAAEQLTPSEREASRRRHAEYFLQLAEESKPALRGPDQARWLDRLDADHDNLRAALDNCRDDPDSGETELRLASALTQYWATRGHLREARARLEDVLARQTDAPTGLRADALHGACFLAYWQSDYHATQTYAQAALDLRLTSDNVVGVIRSLQMLGNAHLYQAHYEQAEAAFEEGLARARAAKDDANCTTSLHGLAILAHWRGDEARARTLYSEGQVILEACGDYRNLALALYNLGEMERNQGNLEAAQDSFERSLALCHEHGAGFVALVQIALGNVSAEQGRYDEAHSLLQDGLRRSRETGESGDVALALRGLGRLAHVQRDLRAARRHLAESLMLHQDQGDTKQIANTLECFAALVLDEGDEQRAACLLGATQALSASLGVRPTRANTAETEKYVARVRSAVGDQAYSALVKQGRSLSVERAAALALQA